MRKFISVLIITLIAAGSWFFTGFFTQAHTVCAETNQNEIRTGTEPSADGTKTADGNETDAEPKPKEFIKWIDFNVTYQLINHAIKTDPKNICELLAYVALRNSNNFNNNARDIKYLNAAIKDPALLEYHKDNRYFKYYVECYHAILDGIVGEYTVNETGGTAYGLKAYHPIAKGFWYNCHDDFGNSRAYGFRRKHLGHDLFGGTGTPIIAVEGGTVAEIGWNRYGGWRIGIRSEDTKRYYYYAHLRKDRPFAAGIEKGGKVAAGQVIGYLGQTGYSRTENVNMKQTRPHLHFGLQIIFDPSQVDGAGEIWIDLHALCRVLSSNRMTVIKDPETNEYRSSTDNSPADSKSADTEQIKTAPPKRKRFFFFRIDNLNR